MLRLTFERKRRGWSQADLGQQLKHTGGYRRALTQSEVSELEVGRLKPTDDMLAALARVFAVAPAFVLLKPITVQDPDERVSA